MSFPVDPLFTRAVVSAMLLEVRVDARLVVGDADLLATFTITAEELSDAAQSQLLWTDQDGQRGIQPGLQDRRAGKKKRGGELP